MKSSFSTSNSNDVTDFLHYQKVNNNKIIISSLIPKGDELMRNRDFYGFIIILILKGSLSLYIENKKTTVRQNEFILILDMTTIQKTHASKNIELRVFYISREYSKKLALEAHINWLPYNYNELFFKTSLSKNEIEICRTYYDLIEKRIVSQSQSRFTQVHNAIIRAAIYELIDLMESHIKQPLFIEQKAENATMRDFIQLIKTTKPNPRKVSWYANKLNITAKYLSTLCRKTTGLTPTRIINIEIYKEALKLIEQSNYAIYEISEMLGFTNPAHFSTFIRRIGGSSPQSIRKD